MNVTFPIYHNEYPYLEDFLRHGCKAKISLGLGTSLRIIEVTKRGRVVAYGQFPHLAGALIDVDRDAKDLHPDLFPVEQYHNKNRVHFHHYPTGCKPREWDDKDRLLYEIGMYYLMDLEISCRKRRISIRPIPRTDIPNLKQPKKKIRFKVGKGRTIIQAFHNLLVGNILPVKRRRRKTLDVVAKEVKNS
jgi:hypothetical protein